jgi:hypothetical protein
VNAHQEAREHYRRKPWTTKTTYGTDRYGCLLYNLDANLGGLPGAEIARPLNSFVVVLGSALIYPFRYGKHRSDDIYRATLKDGHIRKQLLSGDLPQQLRLIPDPRVASGAVTIAPAREVVFLAWAGNDRDGLSRAYLGQATAGPRRRSRRFSLNWYNLTDLQVDWLEGEEESSVAAAVNDQSHPFDSIAEPDLNIAAIEDGDDDGSGT